MASSEAEICSVALKLVGAKPITALTDNTKEARLCATFYPKSLQEVLRIAPWHCALREQVLNQDNPAITTFTFKYSFQLPPDCVRVWATNLDVQWGGEGDTWHIHGRHIVTDMPLVSILYVHLVTDVLLFDTLLEKAITYDLAAKLAYPISLLRDVQQTFDGMRDRAAMQAAGIMSQEQTKMRYKSDDLIKVR